jgi:hypothetical protein
MKNMKRNLLVVLVVVLSLVIFVDFGYSQSLLPWVKFGGTYRVTAGVGTGALTLNAIVNEMDYENGDIWRANVPGVESVYNAKVVLSGATRTGNYSFNGDPVNPDDVRLSIVASDGFIYFDANLADSVFAQSGALYVWLNQNLNPNDLATLNLYNITLNTNTTHPSRYIQELANYLAAENVSGMKMQLRVPISGSFTTNGTGTITYGLIDGLQSLNTPPLANAGEDITIPSNQVASTTINGTVTDADDAFTLTCRWMEGTTVLLDWTFAGLNGECNLDLSTTSLGIGVHTLTLEVNDGELTTSDDMVLTINNSVPNANAGNDITVTTEEVAATTIQGVATDFDGNTLTCSWAEGGNVLQVSPAGSGGECPLNLSSTSLGIGTHTLTLTVTDGQASSSDDMVLTINNTPPVANAGANITVTSEQVAGTTVQGVASDFDGDALTCSWLEGGNVLQVSPAGPNGECPLNLNALSLGSHTLTLEVSDGQTATSDDMIFTVDNSAPHAAPGGAGIYEINTPVTLPGDVSDYDGDMLQYKWSEGTNVLCSGNIQAITGGDPVMLLDCIVSSLSLGTHVISLEVSDGYNVPDKKNVTVIIKDSSAPTISPVASAYIMWPPNHIMVDIAINANAADNSGLPVTLTASVASNEPLNGLGDGDTGPYDWTNPVINQNTGRIDLQLRRERSGRGNGRVYTITITATDSSGNTSTAKVNITVPHDMGKK